MKTRVALVALLCGSFVFAGILQAQTHYPAGVEGIKGPSLPPPGVYFRDYNYMYFASEFEAGPPGFDLFANVQAPRLIYISPAKFLGGYVGVDAIVPLVYQDLDFAGYGDSEFGIGDIFFETTLSWHSNRYDASFGYGLWTPTGDFDVSNPVSPGKGFLGEMITAGVTYYLDKEKTWSVAALNRYEFNHKNDETGITPGQYWTLEWALGKSLSKTFELGVVGLIQTQTTAAGGTGASKEKDHVAAIGPEVNFVLPRLGLSTSVRYLPEFGAKNRPEGQVFNLTFTRRF